MAGFGATTDVWSFAETGISLQGNGSSQQGSTGQAVDSYGNIVEETPYDSGATYNANYKVCAGKTVTFYDTTTAVDFRLGKVISGKVITSIEVTRSNTDVMEIAISGENCPAADSAVAKFTPLFPADTSAPYLAGGKHAIEAGIGVTAGRVVSSSCTASVSVSKALDSQGAQICKAVYAGRMDASNELMSSDTAPAAAAADSTWTLAKTVSTAETNTGYPTATYEAYKHLAQDS